LAVAERALLFRPRFVKPYLLMTHKYLLCFILLPHDIGELLEIGNRASVGFCHTTYEVTLTPSLGIERSVAAKKEQI
jgi:hypothetical protein